jgi:hypothetical protein
MGLCGDEYVSIRSILDGDFEIFNVAHKCTGETQIWVLTFPLRTGTERKRKLLEIGRIKHVRQSLRLTKETYLF